MFVYVYIRLIAFEVRASGIKVRAINWLWERLMASSKQSRAGKAKLSNLMKNNEKLAFHLLTWRQKHNYYLVFQHNL